MWYRCYTSHRYFKQGEWDGWTFLTSLNPGPQYRAFYGAVCTLSIANSTFTKWSIVSLFFIVLLRNYNLNALMVLLVSFYNSNSNSNYDYNYNSVRSYYTVSHIICTHNRTSVLGEGVLCTEYIKTICTLPPYLDINAH